MPTGDPMVQCVFCHMFYYPRNGHYCITQQPQHTVSPMLIEAQSLEDRIQALEDRVRALENDKHYRGGQ